MAPAMTTTPVPSAAVLRYRAVRFHRIGDPLDVLQLDELVPQPLRKGEVRIRVEAFALNRADWLFCRGQHYSAPNLPSRIGSECAGVVVELGPEVDEALLGKQVCTVPFDNSEYGVHGEYAVVPAAYLAPWPVGLSAVEAASTWMQYLTAYFALVEVGKTGPGDHVLIPAASSSAGLAAIQLARILGATVIATSRGASKLPSITAAGANHALALDTTPDLAARINEISGNRGVGLVYDPVGGPFLAAYVGALARGAKILIYGLLSGATTELDLVPLVRKAASIHPYSMFNHVIDPAQLGRGIEFIMRAIRSGVRPVIDSQYDLHRIDDAYRRLDTYAQVGKIVVSCTPPSA